MKPWRGPAGKRQPGQYSASRSPPRRHSRSRSGRADWSRDGGLPPGHRSYSCSRDRDRSRSRSPDRTVVARPAAWLATVTAATAQPPRYEERSAPVDTYHPSDYAAAPYPSDYAAVTDYQSYQGWAMNDGEGVVEHDEGEEAGRSPSCQPMRSRSRSRDEYGREVRASAERERSRSRSPSNGYPDRRGSPRSDNRRGGYSPRGDYEYSRRGDYNEYDHREDYERRRGYDDHGRRGGYDDHYREENRDNRDTEYDRDRYGGERSGNYDYDDPRHDNRAWISEFKRNRNKDSLWEMSHRADEDRYFDKHRKLPAYDD